MGSALFCFGSSGSGRALLTPARAVTGSKGTSRHFLKWGSGARRLGPAAPERGEDAQRSEADEEQRHVALSMD